MPISIGDQMAGPRTTKVDEAQAEARYVMLVLKIF